MTTWFRPVAADSDRGILWLVAWTSLWLGLAEIAGLMSARILLGRYTHMNPQNAWMTPLWYLAAGLIASGLTLLLWRGRSAARRATAVFLATWIGTIGVLFLTERVHKVALIMLAAGIALQYTRIVLRYPFAPRLVGATRLAPILLVVLIFLGVNGSALAYGRVSGVAASSSGESRNVLLIILDTVRAASLSLYGSERKTTPRLEALAQRGVVFDKAFSTTSWTLPSHSSMFTGLWPHEMSADWRVPLDGRPTTLAEMLARRGYRTAGFVANTFYGSKESGLARGFGHYEDFQMFSPPRFLVASTIGRALINERSFREAFGLLDIPGRISADDINARFLNWHKRHGKDAPFFAFLNYFDAHAPYLPPSPFDTMYGALLPGRDPSMREGRSYTERELQAEVDAYDGAIAYLDSRIGMLLDSLEGRGALDNTLVVVTSDHGEEFGTHGLYTHGNSLYDDVLHVPLLLVLPGRVPEGGRIRHWVSLRDLPSTILDVIGADEAFSGRTMSRLWAVAAAATLPADTLIASIRHNSGRPPHYPTTQGSLRAALHAPYVYIAGPNTAEQLFDLFADPRELDNIGYLPHAQPVRTGLRAYLDRLVGESY